MATRTAQLLQHFYKLLNLLNWVNRGGMALISKRYFPFAKYLTALCDTFISEEIVCRQGNDCLKSGTEEILTSVELKKLWNQCHEEEFKVMIGFSEHNDKIFLKIVKKTINSRFSFEISKVRAKNLVTTPNHRVLRLTVLI